MSNSPYLNTCEAADYLRLSRRTLERFRREGGGPAFRLLGRRRCVYALDDLAAWATASRFTSTAEAAEAARRAAARRHS